MVELGYYDWIRKYLSPENVTIWGSNISKVLSPIRHKIHARRNDKKKREEIENDQHTICCYTVYFGQKRKKCKNGPFFGKIFLRVSLQIHSDISS